VTFRTRIFVGVLAATVLAMAVASWTIERLVAGRMASEIEAALLNEARLLGALIEGRPIAADLDAEADRLGRLVTARVTFVAADGRVLGDSEVDRRELPSLENHLGREEIQEAIATGIGSAERLSHTTGVRTMYTAVAVRDSPVSFVRTALPLTEVDRQVARVRRGALAGLGVGVLVALALAGITSQRLNRRVQAVADTARRYRAGDFSRPARDYGRDEIGMVAQVLDDTARELGARLADMARERAHMEAILSGMTEGVLLANRDGRLLLLNPAAQTMLQIPGASAGAHYLEVVRQPDIAAQLASALAGREPAPVDVQLDRQTRRFFIARVVPLARERGGGAVLVLHDITDLRRADQVRRDFVANVSHELRTPLTAIRGYVEALLDSALASPKPVGEGGPKPAGEGGPPSPDDTHRFLEIIARHTLRMEHLVRDLLRLARLDAGQESLDRTTVSLGTVIGGIDDEMQAALESRGQQIAIDIAADADAVPGDPAKLHDVFRNLIENASHYSAEGATIEVIARRAGSHVEIAVLDRGPGIPPADLQRIFERFYRVDRSRTRDPGGTGLGLSIVKHLIELHKGSVRAENRQGGGAVVTVSLPTAPSADRVIG
jgi:two-component system phosphate regulon sensor histidine kinase PhoR